MSKPNVGAELMAMWREALNDVRGTVMQTAFGQPEHPQGIGTPLSPPMQEITEDRSREQGQGMVDKLGEWLEAAFNTGMGKEDKGKDHSAMYFTNPEPEMER